MESNYSHAWTMNRLQTLLTTSLLFMPYIYFSIFSYFCLFVDSSCWVLALAYPNVLGTKKLCWCWNKLRINTTNIQTANIKRKQCKTAYLNGTNNIEQMDKRDEEFSRWQKLNRQTEKCWHQRRKWILSKNWISTLFPKLDIREEAPLTGWINHRWQRAWVITK